MEIAISLLVLRCTDVNLTRRFYELLGLVFAEEKHGTGPLHYAWENGGFVLELYPASGQQVPDNVRLGFSTPFLADVSGNIVHRPDIKVLKAPYTTDDRVVMLLEDPDGRKVEVSQLLHR
jgi:lactoylglutathione lyase